MQIVYLVRKDFMLVRKYWLLLLGISVGLSLFLQSRVNLPKPSLLAMLLMTIYIQYILFNYVSQQEYKYNGAALLCAAPYDRRAVVLAKYVLLGCIFAGMWAINALVALVLPHVVEMPGALAGGLTAFASAIMYGILIPIQYRYGYDKSKFIFAALIMSQPFVLPFLFRWPAEHLPALQAAFPFSQPVLGMLLGVMALLVVWSSSSAAIYIFERQSL